MKRAAHDGPLTHSTPYGDRFNKFMPELEPEERAYLMERGEFGVPSVGGALGVLGGSALGGLLGAAGGAALGHKYGPDDQNKNIATTVLGGYAGLGIGGVASLLAAMKIHDAFKKKKYKKMLATGLETGKIKDAPNAEK